MSENRTKHRMEIAGRVRAVRLGRFGDDVDLLAVALGLPSETWLNYEAGVVMPAEILLHYMTLTGVDPEWLLTGRGERRESLPLDLDHEGLVSRRRSILKPGDESG